MDVQSLCSCYDYGYTYCRDYCRCCHLVFYECIGYMSELYDSAVEIWEGEADYRSVHSGSIIRSYKRLIREDPPKRRFKQKLFRNRYTWKGDGFILKYIFLEGDNVEFPNGYDESDIQRTFDKDGTGLLTGVQYSLGKRKRWLLPDHLQEELPDVDDFELPYPLETVSLVKMVHERVQHFLYSVLPYYDSINKRNVGREGILKVRRQADGTSTTYDGVYSSMNQFLELASKAEGRKLHFQYQVLECETIPGLHNSRKLECSCCRCRYRSRCPAELELHRLGKDIPRSGYLWPEEQETSDSDYEEEELEESESPQKTFSLGDCVIRREKRRVKKRVHNDSWVFV